MSQIFINFFNTDNVDNDIELANNLFSNICSDVLQCHNLDLKFCVKQSIDIETFKENNFFKNKISDRLYNYIINRYKYKKPSYFIYKEFLIYPQDYLILFTKPLLLNIKKIIKKDIIDININNETEIIDFLHTYIYSLLVYYEILSKQMNYLRKTHNVLLPIYSLLDKNSKILQHNNAKSHHLQYLVEQDYIKNKNLINNTVPIDIICKDIINKYNENSELSDDISKSNKILYNIYKIADKFITENNFPYNLVEDLIHQLYQYFVIDKYKKDFLYQYTPTNSNIDNIALININEIFN